MVVQGVVNYRWVVADSQWVGMVVGVSIPVRGVEG